MRIIAYVCLAIVAACVVGILVAWARRPELSPMRVMMNYWPAYIVVVVATVICVAAKEHR